MNSKQLLILVVALAVLGGAALMLVKKDSETRLGGGRGEGGNLLADLPVGEELARFSIHQGTNTLTLAKEEGLWQVKERGGYPANYTEISRTVLKLRDLKAGQTEEVGGSQLARLELLEPGAEEGGGTLIEFRDSEDELLGALLLGKTQTRKETAPSPMGGGEPREMPVGRWVMNPALKTSAALVSDPLSNLQTTPGAWLNKDFIKVQKIKSVEVTYPDETTNSFTLSRETESGEWTLDGMKENEELDTTKTSSFNSALSSPSFNDVLVGDDAEEVGLDKPTRVEIETFEGFDYVIEAGYRGAGDIPMQVAVTGTYPREREAAEDEDESVKVEKDKEFALTLKTRDEKLEKEQAFGQWTYAVSSWTLDSLLKKRSELVKEKEPEEESAPAETVDPVEGLLDLPSAD